MMDETRCLSRGGWRQNKKRNCEPFEKATKVLNYLRIFAQKLSSPKLSGTVNYLSMSKSIARVVQLRMKPVDSKLASQSYLPTPVGT